MYDLICWSVMGLHANPDPRFDGKETRLTNPQRPAPLPEINQAGGAALQTGMPVFRPAPPAKVVVGTSQDGCRSSDAIRLPGNGCGSCAVSHVAPLVRETMANAPPGASVLARSSGKQFASHLIARIKCPLLKPELFSEAPHSTRLRPRP